MDFQLNEEQEELRQMARGFLTERSGPEQVRDAMQTPIGYDIETWRQIAVELGWPSVHIPEAYGGLGLGHVDLAVLLEATGETLLCAPFFSTVALGVNTILQIGTEAQKAEQLPELAEGTQTATLAFAEASGQWDASEIETIATPDGDGFRLKGRKCWVVDGHSADVLFVAARAPGSIGEEGLSVFRLPGDTPGITRKARATMDQTRRLAEIELSGVRVGPDALLGESGQAWPGLRRTLDLAAIALAAEQVGGAQRCLDLSVSYAGEREQFARPIGSFQAIKHKLADMYISSTLARSNCYYGAWALSIDAPELALAAATARVTATQAYDECAKENIQTHGGMGFTWEFDCHMYFRRAKALAVNLGGLTSWQDRLVSALETTTKQEA
jgi:alkylation response protein AidB-like acyl-CoA dehydrogenase